MASTTNYSWSTPDDTGLVKDGALNIRTLGSAVDSTLFSVSGGKNVGMVLLNATTVTNASILTIDNVFTTSYDNYVIYFEWERTSGAPSRQWFNYIKSDGTALTGSYFVGNFNTAVAATSTVNLGGTYTNLGLIGICSTTRNVYRLEVKNPQTAGSVNCFALGQGTSTDYASFSSTYVANGTTKLRGISLYNDSGNFTGTARIYGLRNS